MIKLVDLLVRRDGWNHEEFVEYWYEEHSPLARELPGVQKYATSVPADPEKAGYDGVVELYFEDSSDIAAAFDSEAGERLQADAAEFVDLDAGPTLVVEETVQFDRTE